MEIGKVIDEREMLETLRIASKNGKKVAIIGTGNHSKKVADLIISTARMSDFTIRDSEVIAQAGCPISKIREEAMSMDLLFPSLYDGTVGGLLATNEAYPISTAYGTPYSFTQWTRIVTNSGVLKWKGLIGSKGLLGGFTEASMRLYPRPSRVETFTTKLEEKDLIQVYNKVINLNPLAFLIEYDNGFTIHVSLTEGKIDGMDSYEGVPLVEESDKGSYMVKVDDISSFIELVNKVRPIYAYYIQGVKWSKVYTSEESELNGWEHFNSTEVPKVVWKLKTILDHWNTLV
ncbi:MAG: FAD-binding protein [Metallosphaera sp.]|uniref:FAD-binding oxidoreductase n=1 Tax=Metallosphaera sp. TaxID=2020860 RepID=UPI00316A19B1